jgi:hypothetical protein
MLSRDPCTTRHHCSAAALARIGECCFAVICRSVASVASVACRFCHFSGLGVTPCSHPRSHCHARARAGLATHDVPPLYKSASAAHAVEECSMASSILIATTSFQPIVSPFRRREMTVETSARFGTAVYSPKYTFNLPSSTASDALPCHAHSCLLRSRLACPSCPRCRTPSDQRARYPRFIQSIASS